MSLVLNGFKVDDDLAHLMSRPDWRGKRASKAWLQHFPAHPASGHQFVPFVDLITPESAVRENSAVLSSELAILLHGEPNAQIPPGNFDPSAGYIIGFTDRVDSAICVDLRPATPRLIYECHGPKLAVFATAFDSLAKFVEFYHAQHGN